MPSLVRRLLALLARPVMPLLYKLSDVRDPWERITSVHIPATVFGPGSQRDFGWYFEGKSAIKVSSLEDVQAWLESCEYVADQELFREADFWQHPCTFERLHCGDCEDFALWAWRKLVELGYDADLVVGRCAVEPVTGQVLARLQRHAWVVFRRDSSAYVYEPTVRDRKEAVQLFDVVRDRYVPEFGVGPTRRPFGFCGYLLATRENELRPVG